MSSQNSAAAKATTSTYLVSCTVGNVGMAGAPIATLHLVVSPSSHKVTGMVEITQAVLNGNYEGTVTGTIYSTGLGSVTQVVGLKGLIHSATSDMPLEISFEANLAIDNSWNGEGGFSYANTHVENAPVRVIV